MSTNYCINPESDGCLFAKIMEDFLKTCCLKVKFSTLVRYQGIIHLYISPFFAEFHKVDFCQQAVNRFTLRLMQYRKRNGDNLAPKTIKDILAVLKLLINFAIEKKYLDFQPIHFLLPRQKKSRINILSAEQVHILEEFVLSDIDSYKVGILLCLYTGLRIGELCALRWNDVDCENKTLSINKTALRLSDHPEAPKQKTKIYITSPKTAASERIIPIPRKILDLLKLRKSAVDLRDNPYFLTNSSKLIEPRNYYRRYKEYLKECHLPDFTFHVLRHTFATHCIEIGIDPKVLSEILGHSSVKITLDLYVHPSMETKRKCLDLL